MNELINKLLPYERDLFLALNGSDSLFWDNAMWVYSGLITWVPMVLLIVYIAFRNQQLKQGMLVLGSILLVLLLSSITSGFFFKPLFKRLRPSHHPDYKSIVDLVNNFRGGDYGFISGHATNSFGLAFFISFLFRNRFATMSIMLWAILNSYSRIYLGVHFISDIVTGFIMGAIIGYVVYKIYLKIGVTYLNASFSENNESVYSHKQGNMLAVVVFLCIVLVILFSPYLDTFSHSIIPESWF